MPSLQQQLDEINKKLDRLLGVTEQKCIVCADTALAEYLHLPLCAVHFEEARKLDRTIFVNKAIWERFVIMVENLR